MWMLRRRTSSAGMPLARERMRAVMRRFVGWGECWGEPSSVVWVGSRAPSTHRHGRHSSKHTCMHTGSIFRPSGAGRGAVRAVYTTTTTNNNHHDQQVLTPRPRFPDQARHGCYGLLPWPVCCAMRGDVEHLHFLVAASFRATRERSWCGVVVAPVVVGCPSARAPVCVMRWSPIGMRWVGLAGVGHGQSRTEVSRNARWDDKGGREGR